MTPPCVAGLAASFIRPALRQDCGIITSKLAGYLGVFYISDHIMEERTGDCGFFRLLARKVKF